MCKMGDSGGVKIFYITKSNTVKIKCILFRETENNWGIINKD